MNCNCETLERRRLLTITLDPSSGKLDIEGTPQADHVIVDRLGSQLTVDFNGAVTRYPYASVTEIDINGNAGNDLLILRPAVFIPAMIDGNDGNDLIIG